MVAVWDTCKSHFGYLLFWLETGPREVTAESTWKKTVDDVQLCSSFQVTWLRINQGTGKSSSQRLGDWKALGQQARRGWDWPRSHEKDSISPFMGQRQSQKQDRGTLSLPWGFFTSDKRNLLQQWQENRRCSSQKGGMDRNRGGGPPAVPGGQAYCSG